MYGLPSISICLSVSISVCLSMSACLSLSLGVCLPVCLYLWVRVCLCLSSVSLFSVFVSAQVVVINWHLGVLSLELICLGKIRYRDCQQFNIRV